jgi:hypothetical protein
LKRRWAARCPSGNERVDLIRRGLVAAVAEHRQHVERDQLLHQFLTARGILDRSLNLGPRDAEEPHEHFPVVRHEQIEFSPEMAGQRGTAAPGRDGEEEITATYDSRDDEVGLPRVVHHAHENASAARIGTHFGIHRTVVGGRHDERHPGKVLDRVSSLDERHRGGGDESRERRLKARTHHHHMRASLHEPGHLASPNFATADDEDMTIAETQNNWIETTATLSRHAKHLPRPPWSPQAPGRVRQDQMPGPSGQAPAGAAHARRTRMTLPG